MSSQLKMCMICSENDLIPYFQNESYISQLFTRKFSPKKKETKCLKGVAVGDQDSQYL